MKKQIPVKVIAFVMLSSLITGSVALASPSGAPPSPNLPNATFNEVVANGSITGGDIVAGTGIGVAGNSKTGIGIRGIAGGAQPAVLGFNNSGPTDSAGVGVRGYTSAGNDSSVGGDFSYNLGLLNRVTLGTFLQSIRATGPVAFNDSISNDGLNYNGALRFDDIDGVEITGPITTATSGGLRIGSPVNLTYKILELGNYDSSTKAWTSLVEFLNNGAWHSSNGTPLKIQNDTGFQVGPFTPNAAGGPQSATFDPNFEVNGLGVLSNPGTRYSGNIQINDGVNITGQIKATSGIGKIYKKLAPSTNVIAPSADYGYAGTVTCAAGERLLSCGIDYSTSGNAVLSQVNMIETPGVVTCNVYAFNRSTVSSTTGGAYGMCYDPNGTW